MPEPTEAYRDDLAYIHDAGFGNIARSAAQTLLVALRTGRHRSGTVVELGCGSGILSERVAQAGYDVVGFDISPAMIELAQARVPRGDFRQQSFLDVQLPRCVAITAVGEIVNYLFDRRRAESRLPQLFARAFAALEPGGILLLDVAGPGRAGRSGQVRNYSEGDDWACLFTADEDRRRGILTRTITSFRRAGAGYRRDQEIHRLRLYAPAEVRAQLRAAGFRVQSFSAYEDQPLPHGLRAFLARKPIK